MLYLLVYATVVLARASGDEIVSANISCPTNWTQLDNSRCFHFVPTTLSWARAQKHCQSKGANLVSIHSVDEVSKIQQALQLNAGMHKKAWIGGTDCQEENTWLWGDGTRFKFNYWCPGQPDPEQPQKQCCVHISSKDERCWENSLCYELLPSVCAKPSNDTRS